MRASSDRALARDNSKRGTALTTTTTTVVEKDATNVEVDEHGAPQRVNEYVVHEELGRGAFARVYKCTKLEDDEPKEFAIKVFNKSLLKRKQEFTRVAGRMVATNAFQKVQREIAIMKKLRHPNLTRLHEVIDSPEDDKLYLILNVISGGQLMDFDNHAMLYRYTHEPGPSLDERSVTPLRVVHDCLADLAWALDYLHRNHICHRDIKPENVLVTDDSDYILGDFGVAHMFSESNHATLLKSTEGTYHYLAPECTTGTHMDIWALGVTVFAMVFGTLPFGMTVTDGPAGVLRAIREDPLVLPHEIDPLLHNLLTQLLDKSPATRISIVQVQEHPWITTAAARKAPNPIDTITVTSDEMAKAFTASYELFLMVKLKRSLHAKLARARTVLATKQNEISTATATAITESVNAVRRRSTRKVSDTAIPVCGRADPACHVM
ncbi:CAMKK protein kinase [Saprolegnia parasitica CBS 223.65]|uniref:CAMKK protein kinase n=1 Tax=Saprolegnia parasitica (strain CBS 223.65) TaxID=695850 RepID=A0A067BN28_SAPPC|nr:CAMKK protein kinase [Saprolegnia parasitica CBS 223.65]KDO19899.1 CAMKK protein kinase [Saprolegnia parasitica CBS 223.65]|eukprot:XP_012209401.1 CAMKK protein kinase [Saprolegnia parasitica CBS 223.65]